MKLSTRISLVPALLCAGLLFASGANAALQSQSGGQTLYDTDLNIVWLADANYALTSHYAENAGYSTDGRLTWAQATAWIASLNAENGGIGHLGFNDWRLPTTDHCEDYGCTSSEMGHLFYQELGGEAHKSIAAKHNANYDLFQQVGSGYYWSGSAKGSAYAWSIDFANGYQGTSGTTSLAYAMAVRAVPEPESFVLMMVGLGVIGAVARRRRA